MEATDGNYFVVTITQGSTISYYLFQNHTKREIMRHIVADDMFGESLTSIEFSAPIQTEDSILIASVNTQSD